MLAWLVAAGAVFALIWLDPCKNSRPTAKPEPPTDASVVSAKDAFDAEPFDAEPFDAEPADAEPADPEQADADVAVIQPEVVDAPSTPPAPALYTVTEAFADIAADPLVFIGTGKWSGNYSIHGCAYRNSRVIVAYTYCTGKEQPALGLEVFSPSRGHLKIYAEGESAISTSAHATWSTFRIEASPLPPDDPLALDVTYADLNAWEERRYNLHVGGCWSGERGALADSCSSGLESSLAAWLPSAKEFLAAPPDEFYRLVKDLRARTVRDRRRGK